MTQYDTFVPLGSCMIPDQPVAVDLVLSYSINYDKAGCCQPIWNLFMKCTVTPTLTQWSDRGVCCLNDVGSKLPVLVYGVRMAWGKMKFTQQYTTYFQLEVIPELEHVLVVIPLLFVNYDYEFLLMKK